MAISEACQLWIEQRVEEELETGKPYRAIGRELAAEIERIFEAKVSPSTITNRAWRKGRKDKAVSNETPTPTNQDHNEMEKKPEVKRNEIKIEHGGKREGAGTRRKCGSRLQNSLTNSGTRAYRE